MPSPGLNAPGFVFVFNAGPRIRHMMIGMVSFLRQLMLAASTVTIATSQTLFFVGTYTDTPKSKGIYVYRMDDATGKVTALGLAAETTSPSYLRIHPNGRFLYAANEVGNYKGERSGYLTSFAIDAQSGKLTEINQASSKGSSPCYLAVDSTGHTLLNANYGGGNVIACPIKPDGGLGEATSNIQHSGAGATPRQKRPHAHSINISADNRFAVAADLGLDEMLVYRLNAADSTLTPNDPPFTKIEAGSGPRHFAFHPSGKFAYSINELKSTITAFAWDGRKGVLTELQTQSNLPAGFTGENTTAEIVVSPSGKFVYGSNRGHDSIAVYRVDPAKGTLTPVEYVSTQGKTPRNFNIHPNGKWLVAANQDSDSLVVFKVDPNSGRITPAGQTLEVGKPVCVKFLSK